MLSNYQMINNQQLTLKWASYHLLHEVVAHRSLFPVTPLWESMARNRVMDALLEMLIVSGLLEDGY